LHVRQHREALQEVVTEIKRLQLWQLQVDFFDVAVGGVDHSQVTILIENIDVIDHVSAQVNNF